MLRGKEDKDGVNEGDYCRHVQYIKCKSYREELCTLVACCSAIPLFPSSAASPSSTTFPPPPPTPLPFPHQHIGPLFGKSL